MSSLQMPPHIVFPPKRLGVALTAINWTGILRWQMHFALVFLEVSSEVRAIVTAVVVADLVGIVLFGVPTVECCQCQSYFGGAFEIL